MSDMVLKSHIFFFFGGGGGCRVGRQIINNRCVFLEKYILTFLMCVEFLNVLVSGVLLHKIITINISAVNNFFLLAFCVFYQF
jgi:hypothetical protein